MPGKIVLSLNGIAFLVYGVMILLDPMLPSSLAGLASETGDGFAELAAMYGGLQTGFGLFCLLAALRKDMYRPGLISVVLLMGGLFVGRLYGTIIGTESVGIYTWGAMVFEFSMMGLAIVALLKKEAPGPVTASP